MEEKKREFGFGLCGNFSTWNSGCIGLGYLCSFRSKLIKKMTEIIPAIMPESLDDLRTNMQKVKDLVSCVQIDVMDGMFVPPVTWPYHLEDSEEFNNLAEGKIDMPFIKELEFEVDLMVRGQEEEGERWIRAGARRIVGHLEALDDPERFIKALRDAGVSDDSPLFVEIGLAIEPETSLDELYPFIDALDFVQCMGIAEIGYQGQDFDERVIKKVSSLRKSFPKLIISVDGGVDEDSAQILVEAGANRLVSGSAIFEMDDKAEAIKRLSSF